MVRGRVEGWLGGGWGDGVRGSGWMVRGGWREG